MQSRHLNLLLLPFLFVILVPLGVSAQTVGFAGVTLWYDKEPVFAGKTVRIYSALINSSAGDLVGTVEFLDGEVLLGKMPVTVPKGGRVRDVWFDWVPTYGDHKVSARLVGTKLQEVGKEFVDIKPSFGVTGVDARFFDYDTDSDGVGDKGDVDDDGDGFSDTAEKTAGTDPTNKKDYPKTSTGGAVSKGAENTTLTSGEITASLSGAVSALKEQDFSLALEEAKKAVVSADAQVAGWRDTKHAEVATALKKVQAEQADETTKSPLGYAKNAGLWVLEKILSGKLFFYGTILLLLLLIIRFIRNRRNRLY